MKLLKKEQIIWIISIGISFIIVYLICSGLSYSKDCLGETYEYKKITSIQYCEDKEDYSESEGVTKKESVISYASPDMMRVEINCDEMKIKTTEIYNGNSYLYYDNISNKILKRECFSGNVPDIIKTSKNIVEMINSGKYELMGYEDKDDKKIQIAGTKYKTEGHSYIYKVWITTVNDVVLPLEEEYFIDNVVVSKTSYLYLNVNELIAKDMFSSQSLPSVDTINDGVEPKYVESLNDAKKYISFKLIEPEGIPEEYKFSGITLFPPVKSPLVLFSYIKNGQKLEFTEEEKKDFQANGMLGKTPCNFQKTINGVYIIWNNENITITLHAGINLIKDAVSAAEEMADGRLRVDENMLNAREVNG